MKSTYYPRGAGLTKPDGLTVAIFVMIFGGFSTFSKSGDIPRSNGDR
jgi:hypothetical protein